jgi:hypothetical protein
MDGGDIDETRNASSKGVANEVERGLFFIRQLRIGGWFRSGESASREVYDTIHVSERILSRLALFQVAK